VEAHVGLPVAGEVLGHVVHRGDQLVERLELLRLGARRGQRRDPQLDAQPDVDGVVPARQQLARRRLGRRRALGDERAAAAAADRVQVAALGQRGERLAQRRARDLQPRAQLPLGGQPRAGSEQADLDRGAEPLEGLLESGLGPDRREDGVE
jgi:hypothetical protein